MKNKESRRRILISVLEKLPEHRLIWIEKVSDILNCPHKYVLYDESLMSENWSLAFGDALMIHHAFSSEPFTKDKFEHAFVNTAKMANIQADLAPRGHRGYDLVINSFKYSLKTQADRNIKKNSIWISKYMELGRGVWTDQPEQLIQLRNSFIEHLNDSDRILILRCLQKFPSWHYELVDIPKEILMRCKFGKFEMMLNSKQMPKPGYCTVYSKNDEIEFQLYFDGGGERKLQIKSLQKKNCKLIAEWSFEQNILIE